MITIYTTCRSFGNDEFNRIQNNAIGSWLRLKPKPQIIILGNDGGVAEFCQKHKCLHIPHVPKSETSAPILNSMMSMAEEAAANKILLLISSDIILFQDTIETAKLLSSKMPRFCAGLLKQDILESQPIDFSDPKWAEALKSLPRQSGGWGGDYYLYSKGFWNNSVPPFSIGRTYCDNWLYYYAFKRNLLVDVTKSTLAIHGKHGYAHVGEKKVAVNGEESIKNKKLAGESVKDKAHTTTIAWANWEVDENKKLHKRSLAKCEIDTKGNRIYEFKYGS